jgi:hypothetical protein
MRTWMVLLLLCALCVTAQAYPTLYEYAQSYTYQSRIDASGYYMWSLRNESITQALTGWDWQGGSITAIPGSEVVEAGLPLPTAQGIRPWLNVALMTTATPLTVPSTITWADGSQAVVPIYMPTAVPEPAGLLVLAVGVSAVLPVLRGRRPTSRHRG